MLDLTHERSLVEAHQQKQLEVSVSRDISCTSQQGRSTVIGWQVQWLKHDLNISESLDSNLSSIYFYVLDGDEIYRETGKDEQVDS